MANRLFLNANRVQSNCLMNGSLNTGGENDFFLGVHFVMHSVSEELNADCGLVFEQNFGHQTRGQYMKIMGIRVGVDVGIGRRGATAVRVDVGLHYGGSQLDRTVDVSRLNAQLIDRLLMKQCQWRWILPRGHFDRTTGAVESIGHYFRVHILLVFHEERQHVSETPAFGAKLLSPLIKVSRVTPMGGHWNRL